MIVISLIMNIWTLMVHYVKQETALASVDLISKYPSYWGLRVTACSVIGIIKILIFFREGMYICSYDKRTRIAQSAFFFLPFKSFTFYAKKC